MPPLTRSHHVYSAGASVRTALSTPARSSCTTNLTVTTPAGNSRASWWSRSSQSFKEQLQQAGGRKGGSESQSPSRGSSSQSPTRGPRSDVPPSVVQRRPSQVKRPANEPGPSKTASMQLAAVDRRSAGQTGASMLYAGLKFTGLALKVATDLAKAVSTDAERMVSQVESSNNDRVRKL